jgi:hypothetical protein
VEKPATRSVDYEVGFAAAAAAALAARPSGLAAEKPGFVADACWFSQFSDRATVVPAVEWEPLWATLSLRWFTTKHFSFDSWSPTVTATMALNPALLNADEASPYVWPVTRGAAAPAAPVDINDIADTNAAVLTIRTIKVYIAPTNFPCRSKTAFLGWTRLRPSTRLDSALGWLRER